MLDILENEDAGQALARTLYDYNVVLERDHGLTLTGRLAGEIEPFAVSMGAVYVGADADFDKVQEEAYKQLELAKGVLTKRTVRLTEAAGDGSFAALSTYSASTGEIGGGSAARSPWEFLGTEKKQGIEPFRGAHQDEEAVLGLKFGNNGALHEKIYFALMAQLSEDFHVATGVASRLTPEDIMAIWGPTGIKDRLAKIDLAEARQFAAEIEDGTVDPAVFVRWLRGVNSNSPHVRILTWLWNNLGLPFLPISLTLKEGTTKQMVLAKYGYADAPQDMSLQDVVDLAVGEPHSFNQPSSLRYIVGRELRSGVLYDFFTRSLGEGIPHTAVYAGANGIHSPSYAEYQVRERDIWARLLARKTPYQTAGEEATVAAAEAYDVHDLTIEGVGAAEFIHRGPQEMAAALEASARTLSAQSTSEAERELLNMWSDHIRTSIEDAYAPENEGKYTYYHFLVAISRFLSLVSSDIQSRGDSHLNIYMARDAINFWLPGYLSARNEGRGEQFAQRNRIFSLSRAEMDYAYQWMKEITDVTAAEFKEGRNDYWTIYMRNFRGRMDDNAEFRALVEAVGSRLPAAAVRSGKVRIVESFAEGILTGFLKAVLIVKSGRSAADVEEYITAPKETPVAGRGVTVFDFSVADLAAIPSWFTTEGLTAPRRIDTRPFDQVDKNDVAAVEDLLERRTLEAQIYPMQYPVAEFNIGHPIDSSRGAVVRSGAAKQLGFQALQLAVINALTSPAAGTAGEAVSSPAYSISQDILPQEYRLAGREKALFDLLVRKHGQVFVTSVSDGEQVGLLTRLSLWIRLLSDRSAGDFDAVAGAIEQAENDAAYSWQFERFLFEFRQFGSFSVASLADFHNTMAWLVNSQYQPEDFYDVHVDGPYVLVSITNTLRSLRDVVAKANRNVSGRGRVRIAYGEEASDAGLLQAPRAEAKGFPEMVGEHIDLLNAVQEATGVRDPREDMYVVIAPSFTSKDGKTAYAYQKGVEARFGGPMSVEMLEKWQELVDAGFERLGEGNEDWEQALKGRRSSNLMYVAPASLVIDRKKGDKDKDEVTIKDQVKSILDNATAQLDLLYGGAHDVKVASIMTVFAMPRDGQALKQVYESLHNLTKLSSIPETSALGSRIFTTTFGEVVESVNTTLARKADKGEKEAAAGIATSSFTHRDIRSTLERIARGIGRSKDIADRPVEVYLSYLDWAYKQGLGRSTIPPQAALELSVLSAEDIVRIQLAVRRASLNDDATTAWLKEACALNGVDYDSVSTARARVANITGPSHAGKSSTLHRLDKYFPGVFGADERFVAVDVGNIYRAYAYYIRHLKKTYGDYVVESEENIVYYLARVRVESVNGQVILNGTLLNEYTDLHTRKVEETLAEIQKDNPKVNAFLSAQDRRIVQSIPAHKWVFISSRGFSPYATVNLYLSADLELRVQDEFNAHSAEGMTLDEAREAVRKRDEADEADKALRLYPDMFTIVNTGEHHADRDWIARTVLAKVKEEHDRQNAAAGERAALLHQVKEEDKMLILFEGGRRGALDTGVAEELMAKLHKDFSGIEADLQRGLTPREAVSIWAAEFRAMAEALSEDKISDEAIAEGLRYLDEENGWAFSRWAAMLQKDPRTPVSEKLALLNYAVTYLSGNIRVVKVNGYRGESDRVVDEDGNFDREAYQKELQADVAYELRLTENKQPDAVLWQLWFDSLKDDVDTGRLGFVTLEAQRAGISRETLDEVAVGVEVVTAGEDTQDKLEALLGVLSAEESADLAAGRTDTSMLERQALRDKAIAEGDDEKLAQLRAQVQGLPVSRTGASYADLRAQVLTSGVNAVGGLESFIRHGELFGLIPELRELIHVVSSGTLHESHSRYEHLLLSLRNLFPVEQAARILADDISTMTAAQARFWVVSDEVASRPYFEHLQDIYERYKAAFPGLKDLALADFVEIARLYLKAADIRLTTAGREGDAKLLVLLSAVLHDIATTAAIPAHIMLGGELARNVFLRLGFNEEDARLGAFLIAEHHIFPRLEAGDTTSEGLVARLDRLAHHDKDGILAALIVTPLGDMCCEQDARLMLTSASLRDMIGQVASSPSIRDNAADRRGGLVTRLAQMTSGSIKDPKAFRKAIIAAAQRREGAEEKLSAALNVSSWWFAADASLINELQSIARRSDIWFVWTRASCAGSREEAAGCAAIRERRSKRSRGWPRQDASSNFMKSGSSRQLPPSSSGDWSSICPQA